MKEITGQMPKTKVNTARHADFIEKRAGMARDEKSSGLYRMMHDVSGAWE